MVDAADLRLKAFDSVSEWSKQIVTIASATLVLSATFIKDVLSGNSIHNAYLTAAWIFLLLCIVSGVLVLSTLAASLNKGDPADLDVYGPSTVAVAVVHVLLFLAGMGLFIFFVVVNLTVPRHNSSTPNPQMTFEKQMRKVEDTFFNLNSADLGESARATLLRDRDVLMSAFREFPNDSVVVEGYSDERGSGEYNWRLAHRRASAARIFLVNSGVQGERLKIVSYGKDLPQCEEPHEACWQRNRRVHFAPAAE
jgi:outer membrane protein OmpA-like peptidoglycan-associated protein